MIEHVTTSRLRRFSVQALPLIELTSIAEHLDLCHSCHERFIKILKTRRGQEPLKITLAPEFQFRHDHVDYELLVRIADGTVEPLEREMLDIHLKACAACQEDVKSFLSFREQIDTETQTIRPSFAGETATAKWSWFPWWSGLAWKPFYAAALLVIGMALVIGFMLFAKRQTTLQANHSQPREANIPSPIQTITPENRTAANATPTPLSVPSSPTPRPVMTPGLTVENRRSLRPHDNDRVIAKLNDEAGPVTVDREGNISGLDDISENQRREIVNALVGENIKTPEIQAELAVASINLRGPSSGPSFRLFSPPRTVIVSDRPTFEWQTLKGATSYKVQIGDLKGHAITTSETLPANQTTWTAPTPLKRGEIYSWGVEAVLDGKKIYAPGTAETERKFKVLSASSTEEMTALKKTRSHLALAVFYAREGMVTDAEQELQILIQDNPKSSVLKKLLKQLQSWKSK